MSSYLKLYEKRKSYDCSAQPTFSSDFSQIESDLHTQGIDHPYGISLKTSNKVYHSGLPGWKRAKVSENTKFLYRIDNLYKLFSFNRNNIIDKNRFNSEFNLTNFNNDLVFDSDIPNIFQSMPLNSFYNLNNYLLNYRPFRNISWWTDKSLENIADGQDLLEQALTLGLPTDWINQYSVIMKFEITTVLDNIYIPNIIDAYHSSIFYAINELNDPYSGIAINLLNFSDFINSEFIIRDLNLDSVSFKLIEVPDNNKRYKSHYKESSLINNIINLY